MIAFGLRDDRPLDPSKRARSAVARRSAALPVIPAPTRRSERLVEQAEGQATWLQRSGERRAREYADALSRRSRLLRTLERERGWTAETIAALELGWHAGRIVVPVRDQSGRLVGLRRYQPGRRRLGEPKMLAERGSRNDLFPAPERFALNPDRPMAPGNHILLCEGEPDAIAAISVGAAAVAVPGIEAWRPEWASRFRGRDVLICFDADAPGRAAVERVCDDLMAANASTARAWDPDPLRSDGYDLSDALIDERAGRRAGVRVALLPEVPDDYRVHLDSPDEIRGRDDRACLTSLRRSCARSVGRLTPRGELPDPPTLDRP